MSTLKVDSEGVPLLVQQVWEHDRRHYFRLFDGRELSVSATDVERESPATAYLLRKHPKEKLNILTAFVIDYRMPKLFPNKQAA